MGKMAGFHKVLMGSVCAIGLMLGAQSNAQVASYYDNNVMVDLSVLNDNGVGAASGAVSSRRDLGKLPPATMPKSTFYGLPDSAPQGSASALSTPRMPNPAQQPQSRIVLKKPAQTSSSQMASSSVPLKKPQAPKQVAPKVATPKAAPTPIVKPSPTPKVAQITNTPAPVKAPEPPKPAAAPTQPVEVAKAAPAPEAPKPAATPTPAPAPKELERKEAEAPKVEATPAPAAPKIMADAPPPPPPSAVEPKKVDSAIAEAAKDQTNTAALPPASASNVRIAFQAEQSKMPSTAEAELKDLAELLKKQPDDRVQLLAYAGGESLSASKARRLSLSRALTVRTYLMSQGVGSTRIDVRALGNKTTEEPFDRVDVQIAPR